MFEWKEAPGIEPNWHLIVRGKPVAVISKDIRKGDYLVSPIGSTRVVGVGATLEEAKKVAEKLWRPSQEVKRVPMIVRRKHGERRTAFYVQFWSPKDDPEISQPYYHSGPEEGAFKDLDQALRSASQLLQRRPDAFHVDIYSQVEEWISDEDDPRFGYWEIVEGTVKGYDTRGKLIYDETDPNLGTVPSVDRLDLTETLPPLTNAEFLRQHRMGTHFYTPDAARRHGPVPRYWYHVPTGRADFGKVIKAYPIREIEAADTFGKGYKEAHYIWLSHQPIYGRDNTYIIDLTKLNNDDLRFTGQVEGNLLHRGDIPADAVVAIMRNGQVIEAPRGR